MMTHKAFLFDYARFDMELRSPLESSLSSDNCANVIAFIKRNLDALSDPYEGEPLDGDWESMIETKDAHQYGDFALTKYYAPTDDIGLGAAWAEVQELVETHNSELTSPILGNVVGSWDAPFDPGKMGSYFQGESDVVESHRRLLDLNENTSCDAIHAALAMLDRAISTRKGLYVTF